MGNQPAIPGCGLSPEHEPNPETKRAEERADVHKEHADDVHQQRLTTRLNPNGTTAPKGTAARVPAFPAIESQYPVKICISRSLRILLYNTSINFFQLVILNT